MTTSPIRATFLLASIWCTACSAEVTVPGDESGADTAAVTCETYCESHETCEPDSYPADCETRCLDEYERQGDPATMCGPVVRRRLQCVVEAYETSGCEGLATACRAEADAVVNCP